MDGNRVDRRAFLLSLSPTVASVAGCQLAPGDGRATAETEPGSTAASDTETDGSPSPTPERESTPAADPIATTIPGDPLSHLPDRSRVIREFMPAVGPASIAVGFPTERTTTPESYCFDAGACRFRYAWHGGLIDIPYVKDDGPATIDGETYYAATRGFPLRFGEEGREPESVDFRGYELVDRLPEFRYVADGTEIRHYLRPVENGPGVAQTFRIPDAEAPIRYVADRNAGVSIDASAGEWAGDRLRVSAAAATEFTVTIRQESA